jgi:hypothetical protein
MNSMGYGRIVMQWIMVELLGFALDCREYAGLALRTGSIELGVTSPKPAKGCKPGKH